MQLITRIEQISAIKIFGSFIFQCMRNGELHLNGVVLLKNVEGQSFWLKDNYLYFHHTNGEHYFYNFSTQKIIKSSFNVAWISIECGQALSSYDIDWQNLTWKTGLLDIDQNILLKEYKNALNKSLLFVAKSTYILSEGRYKICGISKKTGVLEWSFSVSEFGHWYHLFDQKWMDGEIQQTIAVANNVLWVAISGHHLIGIDSRTGQLRHDLSQAHQIFGTPTKDYHRQLPVTFRLEHDPDQNQLFGFCYDTYIEVDLNQAQPCLTMYVLEEACTQQQAFCAYGDRTCFDTQYFYYLDPMSGKIGGVNRRTKTLDWVYRFPDGSTMGLLMQIQVAGPRLYVLDSGGVLHILEREATD